MSRFRHVSRAMGYAELGGAVREALRALAEKQVLGELAGATLCVETTTTQLEKAGIFAKLLGAGDPDTESRSALLLLPKHVVFARAGEKSGAFAMSAPLDTLEFDELPEELAAEGLGLRGAWSRGGAQLSSFVVRLGPEQRDAVRDALRAAIGAAKR